MAARTPRNWHRFGHLQAKQLICQIEEARHKVSVAPRRQAPCDLYPIDLGIVYKASAVRELLDQMVDEDRHVLE